MFVLKSSLDAKLKSNTDDVIQYPGHDRQCAYLDLPGLLVESLEHALCPQAHAVRLQGSEGVRLPAVPARLPLRHQFPDHLQMV